MSIDTAETKRTNSVPSLAYIEGGSGPLVLFVHGVGGNKRNWLPQLAMFKANYRAVSCDLRGYGESEDYEGEFSVVDAACDVIRLLDHLQVDAAHLVGLSLGGCIVLETLRVHPNRIRSVTACSINAGLGTMPASVRIAFLEARLAPLRAGGTLADMADGLVESLLGSMATPRHVSTLRESILALRPASYMKALRAGVTHVNALQAISGMAPTLFLAAEDDRLIPPYTVAAAARSVENARYAVVPHAGHVSNIEQPAAFNAEVLDFINGVESADAQRGAALTNAAAPKIAR
jgi:3-oxoadipate enol-lactonase